MRKIFGPVFYLLIFLVSAGLIGWLAIFHLGDATQGMSVFVLRSYRVTVAPLIAYCVLLWGMGLAGGFALETDRGPRREFKFSVVRDQLSRDG